VPHGCVSSPPPHQRTPQSWNSKRYVNPADEPYFTVAEREEAQARGKGAAAGSGPLVGRARQTEEIRAGLDAFIAQLGGR
jgi:hypothetical protein